MKLKAYYGIQSNLKTNNFKQWRCYFSYWIKIHGIDSATFYLKYNNTNEIFVCLFFIIDAIFISQLG